MTVKWQHKIRKMDFSPVTLADKRAYWGPYSDPTKSAKLHFSKNQKTELGPRIRISGNRYRPVFECSYFFSESDPCKICWFEFWVRRPKRLALVAATTARFRGGGGRGGGDHGGEGRVGGAFVAEASRRRVPRAKRRRRPPGGCRTRVTGELSNLKTTILKT